MRERGHSQDSKRVGVCSLSLSFKNQLAQLHLSGYSEWEDLVYILSLAFLLTRLTATGIIACRTQHLRNRVKDGDHFHATLISPAHHTFLHTLLHWAPRTDFSHRTCACLFFSIHFFFFSQRCDPTILTLSTNKCQRLVNIYLQSRHLCWTLGSDTSVYSALPLEDLRDIQTLYLNAIF